MDGLKRAPTDDEADMTRLLARMMSKRLTRNVVASCGAIAVLFVLPLLPVYGETHVYVLSGAVVLSGLAIGFGFAAGGMGLVNFGYAAFSGTGAYTVAILAGRDGWGIGLSVLVGTAAGAVVGVLVGCLTIRFRGIYVSLVAWFVSMGLSTLALNLNGLTGGAVGAVVPTIESNTLPGYYLLAILVGVTLLFCQCLYGSRLGLQFRVIGADVNAARASGVSVKRYQILNMTISAMIAGLFGGMYALIYGVVTPADVDIAAMIPVFMVVVIAGTQSLVAATLVAIPFSILDQTFSNTANSTPGLGLVLFAVLLLGVVIWYPRGIAGAVAELGGAVRRATGRRRRRASAEA